MASPQEILKKMRFGIALGNGDKPELSTTVANVASNLLAIVVSSDSAVIPEFVAMVYDALVMIRVLFDGLQD